MGKLQSNSSILIIGGSETTATLLSGVTFFLLTNPDALRRVTDEVRSAFESEDDINFTTVNDLPYMLACLNEGLRMYPPVPVGLPRLTPKGGAKICGYYVPEGVCFYPWAILRLNFLTDRFRRPSLASTTGRCTTATSSSRTHSSSTRSASWATRNIPATSARHSSRST